MRTINIIFLILILLLTADISTAQFPCPLPDSIVRTNVPVEAFHNSELQIYNQTKYWRIQEAIDIRVKIVPVGALLNGGFLYTSNAIHNIHVGQPKLITGYDTILPVQTTAASSSLTAGNFDLQGGGSNCNFAFGIGKYKIEFYIRNDTVPPYPAWELVNYVYVDFRNADTASNLPVEYTDSWDIRIDYFNRDTITFQHVPQDSNDIYHNNKFWHINLVNKEIKMWNLFGTCLTPLIPYKGLFIVDTSNSGVYIKWPINANQYNGNLGHENPGDLGMNIEINHNVTTQDTLPSNTNILIPVNGYLKIISGKTFDMKTSVGGSNNLIVQDSSDLILDPYSSLIIDRYNSLTLQNKGEIQLGWGSEIRFKDGSSFCNEGGLITSDTQGDNPGGGRIYFEKGYVNVTCGTTKKHEFRDSAKLVLLDSSVLEVPDSVTLSFTGSGAGLIMNPNSKLKMGVGSKIVFDSSASFIAKGAAFTSIDSTLKWEGIFLSNTEVDSIVNCTFSNAKTALTITNTAN